MVTWGCLGDAPKLIVESISPGQPQPAGHDPGSVGAARPDDADTGRGVYPVLVGVPAVRRRLPALSASARAGPLGVTILLAWSQFGRAIISFSTLLYAPFYALKKIPLYLGFLIKRQVEWVRSKRDAPDARICLAAPLENNYPDNSGWSPMPPKNSYLIDDLSRFDGNNSAWIRQRARHEPGSG